MDLVSRALESCSIGKTMLEATVSITINDADNRSAYLTPVDTTKSSSPTIVKITID
jgi:hypothetical protein